MSFMVYYFEEINSNEWLGKPCVSKSKMMIQCKDLNNTNRKRNSNRKKSVFKIGLLVS